MLMLDYLYTAHQTFIVSNEQENPQYNWLYNTKINNTLRAELLLNLQYRGEWNLLLSSKKAIVSDTGFECLCECTLRKVNATLGFYIRKLLPLLIECAWHNEYNYTSRTPPTLTFCDVSVIRSMSCFSTAPSGKQKTSSHCFFKHMNKSSHPEVLMKHSFSNLVVADKYGSLFSPQDKK